MMETYQKLISIWKSKHITTSSQLAVEMDRNSVSFIYHSGKIENDKITYHDTREIFDHGGVTSYTGDVRTLFEIQDLCAGYRRFLDAFEQREPLTESFVRELHAILTQGTYDTHRYEIGERPGTYKLHDFVTGIDEVGALPEDVPLEMSELLDELQDVADEDALTAAAYLHAKLENIHPFADGNGRLGRLLMNYLLVRHGHPPIIIFEEDRRDYYAALERYDREQDLAPLILFLRSQCEKTWSRFLEREALREQHTISVPGVDQDNDYQERMASQLDTAAKQAQERNASQRAKVSETREKYKTR